MHTSILQVVAGILASSDDGTFLTDKSWKCTTRYDENWMLPSFNDESWNIAAIAGENSDSDIHRNMKDIHSSAKWIWTDNFKGATADSTVYCRGYIGKLWMCVCVFAIYSVLLPGIESRLECAFHRGKHSTFIVHMTRAREHFLQKFLSRHKITKQLNSWSSFQR